MAGFIVLEDRRAYAAKDAAVDATLEAISREVEDEEFRRYLLSKRSSVVGMGATFVHLSDIAPQYREVFYRAVEVAAEQARTTNQDDGWRAGLEDLAEMVRRWRRDEPPELYNPHLEDLIDEREPRQEGPGWY